MKKLNFIMMMVLVIAMSTACKSNSTISYDTESDLNAQIHDEKSISNSDAKKLVNWSIGGDIQSLDPAYATDVHSQYIINNIYEGLFREIDGKVEFAVAQSVDISENKLVYTFYLDKKAKWSDGRPVTAYDFEYAWKRSYRIGNELGLSTIFQDSNYNNCLAISSGIFRVWLDKPTPYFLKLTTETPFMPVNRDLYMKEQFGQGGGLNEIEEKNLLVNGPFNVASYKSGQSILLEKNYRYARFMDVSLNRLVIHIVTDPHLAVMAFKSGRADYNTNVPADTIQGLVKDKDQLVKYKKPGISFLEFNNHEKYVVDQGLREAIALVLDRDEIVNQLHRGVLPVQMMIPQSITTDKGRYYNRFRPSKSLSIKMEGYKIEMAQQLMGDVEFDVEHDTLIYLTPEGEANIRIAQSVAKSLKKHLGIRVEIKSTDWNSYINNKKNGEFHIAKSSWICDYNDPYGILKHFEHTLNDESKHVLEKSNFLVGQGRDMLLLSVENNFYDDKMIIPLYNYVGYYQIGSRINNVSVTGMGNVFFGDCNVVEE